MDNKYNKDMEKKVNNFNLDNIIQAYWNIKDVVVETPLVFDKEYSCELGCNIYFKLENRQNSGSFKLRGAYNAMKNNGADMYFTASTGNHAAGVAYSANLLKRKVVVYMPENVSENKIKRVVDMGNGYCEVKLAGNNFYSCCKNAEEKCAQLKGKFIHPFEDLDVIAGQGTMGLEIEKQLDKIDYVLVPIGGGGLASGLACYLKGKNLSIKVIGVESDESKAMSSSIEMGSSFCFPDDERDSKPKSYLVSGTAVNISSEVTYNLCNKYLDDVVIVNSTSVSTNFCSFDFSKIYNLDRRNYGSVEPAGLLALTCIKEHRLRFKNKNVVCIASGQNLSEFDRKCLREFESSIGPS